MKKTARDFIEKYDYKADVYKRQLMELIRNGKLLLSHFENKDQDFILTDEGREIFAWALRSRILEVHRYIELDKKRYSFLYTCLLYTSGGGQELGEGLTETLEREVLEETGYTLSRYSNPRIYDVMVQEGGQDFAVHHIMAFYDIVLDFERSQKSLPQEVLDGSNDSANAIWIPFEQITEKNASPLVLKVKAELVGFPELELTSYINWKTKEG